MTLVADKINSTNLQSFYSIDKGETPVSKKDAYEQQQQAKLNEWDAKINQLKAKADKAGADVKVEYYKQINELRDMQETASQKLTELMNTSGDAWEDLKDGMDSSGDSLGSALKSAASKFK